MTFKKIYRGMENGAETIQENFSAAVSKTDDETISGVKDFRDGLKMKGVTLIDIFYPVGCIYQSVKILNHQLCLAVLGEGLKVKFWLGLMNLTLILI
ncbi:hypothetical protein [Enterococcus rivorum]|uniref:hypothetical protein n=1 Tax=Enterococcus rivorum TaxID=762845 RepID=UPI003637BC35